MSSNVAKEQERVAGRVQRRLGWEKMSPMEYQCLSVLVDQAGKEIGLAEVTKRVAELPRPSSAKGDGQVSLATVSVVLTRLEMMGLVRVRRADDGLGRRTFHAAANAEDALRQNGVRFAMDALAIPLGLRKWIVAAISQSLVANDEGVIAAEGAV